MSLEEVVLFEVPHLYGTFLHVLMVSLAVLQWTCGCALGDEPQGMTTQEGIGRPWRVEPKRDVNGLGGRLKPQLSGAWWFAVVFGQLWITYPPMLMPA